METAEIWESMTAYASAVFQLSGRSHLIALRSVNHKSLRILFHTSGPPDLEEEIRQLISSRVRRGAVDFFLEVQDKAGSMEVLEHELGSWLSMCEAKGLPRPGWSDFFLMQQFLEKQASPLRSGENRDTLLRESALLIDAFLLRRRDEGRRLIGCVSQYAGEIAEILRVIRDRIPGEQDAKIRTLKQRLAGFCSQLSAGEMPELARECAGLLERLDVSEELDRLSAHAEAMASALKKCSNGGRYLDFLCQEMLREANTMSVKVQSPALSQVCIQLKILVEKIREQVQNLA